MISPPGTNLLNTSKKKYHYLIHYKEVFALFDQNNFEVSSKKYKKSLINLLKSYNSNRDFEFYELFLDVFKDNKSCLEDYQNDLDSIYFTYLFNKMLIEDSQEYFVFVKNELEGYKFWQNNKITKSLLQEINLINYYDLYSEFKVEHLELSYKINQRENKSLKKVNKNLNEEFKTVKKTNKELLNSNSLKLVKKIKKLMFK